MLVESLCETGVPVTAGPYMSVTGAIETVISSLQKRTVISSLQKRTSVRVPGIPCLPAALHLSLALV